MVGTLACKGVNSLFLLLGKDHYPLSGHFLSTRNPADAGGEKSLFH
jgi:hypothetical protein